MPKFSLRHRRCASLRSSRTRLMMMRGGLRAALFAGARCMLVLVVGAGVVGLACARAAALKGHEVIVGGGRDVIGRVPSSRNGEVIHAGLYYPTGSLRAPHCPRSRRMLY